MVVFDFQYFHSSLESAILYIFCRRVTQSEGGLWSLDLPSNFCTSRQISDSILMYYYVLKALRVGSNGGGGREKKPLGLISAVPSMKNTS